jgi:hypothetical protein
MGEGNFRDLMKLIYLFAFSLKRLNESYFRVAAEFTHKDVILEINKLLNVTTNFGKGILFN